MKKQMNYRQSGVNIDEGNRFVSKIKKLVAGKSRPEVIGGIGGFGGLFDISKIGIKKPVLVTSIDGVGTKLMVAHAMNKHDTIGIDMVNHSVNDIAVQGAKPLYFTDYLGCGKLDADQMEQVIQGLLKACLENNCELIGGETAEMPGIYRPGDYDLAGAITGIVDRDKIITGQNIVEGDRLIALPSTGLHTNGYSLARKICFEAKKFKVSTKIPELDNKTLGECLLIPHRSYGPLIFDLIKKVTIRGIAHITGGGLTENLPRVFPKNKKIGASISLNQIQVLPIFQCLQKWGNVDLFEMLRVFNMGVGMILILSKKEAEKCLALCRKVYPEACFIGEMTTKTPGRVFYNR
jgi:phosphoribosylformylglycinamidine cyclo-ligase